MLITMPRPKKHRTTFCEPASIYFKPRGIPMYQLKEEFLDKDELEALKLADFESLSQEEAARRMNISRATFGRIVNAARKKVADCIINGKAIKLNE